MKFSELVEQALDLLRRQGRVSYRALKREFELDDDLLADLKEELLFAYAEQVKEEGPGLVWVQEHGAGSKEQGARGEEQRAKSEDKPESSIQRPESEKQREAFSVLTQDARRQTRDTVAERRQLTVLFCDLVGSTALSAQLDPEDYRTVVQEYQQTCAEVIQRHEGYLAQYLGDGLLVYFGYPVAHEDEARRAVRTGLEIVEAMRGQVIGNRGQGKQQALQVRIGIHSGLVVIGEIGSTEKRELLALGETPNIAARIQGLAEPNTVIISAATQRLIDGQFESQPFGSHLVKGIDTPIAVYHVQSERQGLSPLAGRITLTPLVGREQEVGLLIDRWEQAKEGRGQVVLLSGEPGIGKSRLAYTLRERVTAEGSLLFEARCLPYHQHSAFYPLIESFQRTLLLTRQDTENEKIAKLERALALYDMSATLPLFTALLSLPTPAQYPALMLTPQKQKERTLQALLQLMVAQAERQATVSVWEDLHWADPSSLEFLTLLIEQIPTSKLLLVLTFRPEFTPPWKPRSHISQLVLNRLGKKHVEAMITQAAAGNTLSAEVIEQIRVKTDGVPLFVEELTKSVVETGGQGTGDREQVGKTIEPLAIPATLQEALLARLDRLSTARQVAQLGATLGREFSHELIQAVAPLSETDLHAALDKLVEAEILYRRGVGEQARYFFKHALIQDTAYQSLLKSTRQQYHQQIAHILEERFPDTKATQPELLAHHYTEANLIAQAIPYWQQAGQRATERSVYAEAISHLTKGMELLNSLPDTSERIEQELILKTSLGPALITTKGYGAPEVKEVYTRARDLCQQIGETPHLLSLLFGLRLFYLVRAEYQTARELGEQCLKLAEKLQDSTLLLQAHMALGDTLYWLGELVPAQVHLEQGITLYHPQQHRPLAFLQGHDLGINYLSYAVWVSWSLGYPDQALKRSHEALNMARELAHPFSLGFTLTCTAWFHQFLREELAVQEQAEELIALSNEQGFPFFESAGIIQCGWALAKQGHGKEGASLICQGMAAQHATGGENGRTYFFALLAEAYAKADQPEEGLNALAKAIMQLDRTGERFYEAELYRLRGELTLQQESKEQGAKSREQKAKSEEQNSEILEPSSQILDPHGEAEACFLKAIDIARQQQAKSWELRASTSLARLWQSQSRTAEAHKLLSNVYNWFTEGFETKDLQEAKALIEELES